MAATLSPTQADRGTRVTSLRTQHGAGLLGVPGTGLRLTWRAESAEHGAQLAYQIATGPAGGELVPGAVVDSAESVAVPVGDLASGERRGFAVRIATAAGWTAFSDELVVEAGRDARELDAAVIGIPSEVEGPAALLRRVFTVHSLPERARLRLSALGLVNAWINGRPATDAQLTPGWTSYQERVLLDTLDVTPLLREGENVIVLEVGDGWYRGRMGFAMRREIYGDRSGALAQIDTETGVLVATDESWRGGFGAVRSASIYDGTTIDRRFDHRVRPRPVRTALCAADPRGRGARDGTHRPGRRRPVRRRPERVRLGAPGRPWRRGRRDHRPPRGDPRAVRRPAHGSPAHRQGDG
jgi:alpha-L-rhamnosidase